MIVKYGGVRIVTSLKSFTWHYVIFNKSTPKCMIYDELGRPPLLIQMKQRRTNIWIKIFSYR